VLCLAVAGLALFARERKARLLVLGASESLVLVVRVFVPRVETRCARFAALSWCEEETKQTCVQTAEKTWKTRLGNKRCTEIVFRLLRADRQLWRMQKQWI
jgi:hypothetical protein